MITSRRSFIAGIAAAFAAPAIVKASSLMSVRALEKVRYRALTEYNVGSEQLITRCDVLYGHLDVRAEWLGLNEFEERILAPMVNRLSQSIADEIMNKQESALDGLFMNGSQWGSKLIYDKNRRTIVRTIIPASEVFEREPISYNKNRPPIKLSELLRRNLDAA